ncbi:MAG: hypothetical protein AB8B85_13165 [Paracoccaceae bacterium]
MFGAKNSAIRLGFLAGLSMLAACADEGAQSSAPAQASATSSTSAATAAAPAATEGRINMSQCNPPAEGRVAFKVGEAVLRVPGAAIENAVPTGLQGQVKTEAVLQEVQARVSQGEGCPNRPLDSQLLVVQSGLTHQHLGPGLGFRRADDRFTQQYAQLINQLRDNPTGRCQEAQGGLLACRGTETNSGRETDVLYFISTDKAVRMNSGSPLFARCLISAEGISGCAMFDRLAAGSIYETRLNPGKYTSESLKAAQQLIVARISQWRS